MAKITTADDLRRELYDAYHALYTWFTQQPLPADRWHEIDVKSVDRSIALRFVKALDKAEGAEPEWTNLLLHTEPFATLWSHTKYGKPNYRRRRVLLGGSYDIAPQDPPPPERDWHAQFAKLAIPESVRKTKRPLVKGLKGTATKVDLNRIVRQQVKAELKTQLEDDVLVAAFKQEGSYRKAAMYLEKELCRKISKDKVRRAVNRAGGIEKVRETENSESIQRNVPAQRCDRLKKYASPTQPPDTQ